MERFYTINDNNQRINHDALTVGEMKAKTKRTFYDSQSMRMYYFINNEWKWSRIHSTQTMQQHKSNYLTKGKQCYT